MNVMILAMFLTSHQTCDVIRIARRDMFDKNAKCKEFIFHETLSPDLDSSQPKITLKIVKIYEHSSKTMIGNLAKSMKINVWQQASKQQQAASKSRQ